MFGLALVSMFVVGLMLPMIDGPIMAILRGTTAPEMQGCVFTMMNSLLNLTGSISLVFAGPVSDWVGLQVWYVAAEVLCGVLTGVCESPGRLTRAKTTHLVLLDWELPGLEADGLLPTLRELCPRLKVIALSGRPEARHAALDAGVDAFVSKGDPPERLLAAVNDCCHRQHNNEFGRRLLREARNDSDEATSDWAGGIVAIQQPGHLLQFPLRPDVLEGGLRLTQTSLPLFPAVP